MLKNYFKTFMGVWHWWKAPRMAVRVLSTNTRKEILMYFGDTVSLINPDGSRGLEMTIDSGADCVPHVTLILNPDNFHKQGVTIQ